MTNKPTPYPQQDLILRCWPFLLIAFTAILTGLTLQSYYGKNDLHLMLAASGHYPLLDKLFSLITDLGDVLFAVILALAIAWRQGKAGISFYLAAGLMQLIIVQALKHAFFAHQLRPIYYFHEQGITLHSIPGVDQGMYYHFPSGHTAMAFTAFLCLAIFSRRRWWQAACAALAVSVAYSRLYLAQHFILDTIAGALIGIFCVCVSYYAWQYLGRRQTA